jgi:nicotinamide-nucleotide amidase
MKAEIITIGDELLIGQVVDTNSAWMAHELNKQGIKVHQITSVSDEEQHILDALKEASERVELILMTGGLGPTKDDITKYTLCRYFNTELVFDQVTYDNLVRVFKRFGRDITPRNRTQADLPANCIPLINQRGTASGMWFEKDNVVYVSMPGVPHEMKAMMQNDVLPRLKQRFTTSFIMHKTVLTQGIGESFLADQLVTFEDELPAEFKLAYLPASGMVRLRLTAMGEEHHVRTMMDSQLKKLVSIVQPYIYGYDEDALEAVVGRLLKENNKTVCTAESCTGGFVAHLLTRIAGSSDYYVGSTITYSYPSKTNILNVPADLLNKHGAVSEEVVRIMAVECRKLLNADYSVATTGIAGPGGGTNDKPVGTVWIGVASADGVTAKKFQFGGDRQQNIELTGYNALSMLRKTILVAAADKQIN